MTRQKCCIVQLKGAVYEDFRNNNRSVGAVCLRDELRCYGREHLQPKARYRPLCFANRFSVGDIDVRVGGDIVAEERLGIVVYRIRT